MNEKFTRWIKKSLAKHFAAICTAASIKYKIEDDEQITDTWDHWVELRIVEINWREDAQNQYTLNVDIDLLVTSKPLNDNIYKVEDIIGKLAMGIESIPIEKDGVHWFCLSLDREIVHSVKKIDYGRLNGLKTKRASLLAFYQNEIEV